MNFIIRFFKRLSSNKKFKDKSLANLFKKVNFNELQKILKYKIVDKNLFFTALVHRSVLRHLTTLIESNERLEYLGDSVVNLITAKYLFKFFPKANEGELTQYRSYLVSREQLANYALRCNLWNFILMSDNSELTSTSKGGKTILADAFEAILGAIYLDGGIEAVEKFLNPMIKEEIIEGAVSSREKNPKSKLLELLQAEKKQIPRYAIVKQEGPQHDSIFTIAVFVDGVEVARGVGNNKKDAEQKAASEALNKIFAK